MGDNDEDKKKDDPKDFLKLSKYTSEKPDPLIPLLYFFVITCIYCIITIVMGGSNSMQKIIMKSCYILAVIVGEYFLNLKLNHMDEEIYSMFGLYDINKLDINRIYRYLDKYTNKDCKAGGDDKIIIEDLDEDIEKSQNDAEYY